MELSNVQKLLELKEKIRTPLDLVALGEKGVSKEVVSRLAKHLCIGTGEMASLLSVNLRTIQRYSSGKLFPRTMSERLLRIAIVVGRGESVFETQDRFCMWLKEPNRAIGGRTPLSLLSSDFGIEMVLDELGRIEYGIVS
jgi:putative toxin-antitoxin system antitoxin component (TIGR02293 family)